MSRAANTFTLGEVAALLRALDAADRRDTDRAQHHAQTPQALRARKKLLGMRNRIEAEVSRGRLVAEVDAAFLRELNDEPERLPANGYVSDAQRRFAAKRRAG